MNMYRDGLILDQQNHGILACLPKIAGPCENRKLQTLTIMKTDYKVLNRIVANHWRPWLVDKLQPSRHCGLTGNSI
jgi:hypothetical protein